MERDKQVSLAIKAAFEGGDAANKANTFVRKLAEGAVDAKNELDKVSNTLKQLEAFKKAEADLKSLNDEFKRTESVVKKAKDNLSALEKLRDFGGPFNKSARTIQKSIQQSEKSIARYRAGIDILNAKMKESGADTVKLASQKKQLQAALSRTTADLRLQKAAYKENKAAVDQWKSTLNDGKIKKARADLKAYGEEHTKVSGRVNTAKTALDKLKAALKKAGVSTEQAEASTKRLNRQLDRLGKSAKQAKGSLEGFAKASQIFQKISQSSGGPDRFAILAGNLSLAAANTQQVAGKTEQVIGSVIQLADNYRLLEARIGAAVGSQEKGVEVMGRLVDIASESYAPLETVAQLHARLAANAKEAFQNQDEMLEHTKALTNALRISGTSTQEASGALLQYSQAASSGFLRGQEFNSVAEQMPVVLNALAEHLDKTKGELKEMAAQGELTFDVVQEAVAEAADDWAKQAATLPVTLEHAITSLKTQWQSFLGTNEDVVSATDEFSRAIQGLTEKFDDPTFINALNTIIEGMSGFIDNMSSMIDIASDWIVENKELTRSIVSAAAGFGAMSVPLAPLLIALSSLASIIHVSTGLVGGLVKGVYTLTADMAVLTKAMWGMHTATKANVVVLKAYKRAATSIGIGLLAAGAGAAAVGFYKLVDAVDQATEASKNARKNTEDYRNELNKTISANQQYAGLNVKSAEQLRKLSDVELSEYQKRLDGHEQYWRARYLLASDMGVKEESLVGEQAQRKRSLEGIKVLTEELKSRKNLLTDFTSKVKEAKDAEYEILKKNFEEKKRLYDAELKKLDEIENRRKSFDKAIQDARDKLEPEEQNYYEGTRFEASNEVDEARNALRRGDFEDAQKKSEKVIEIITRLADAGTITRQYASALLDETAEIGNEALAGLEEKQKQSVENAKQVLQDLKNNVDYLKSIEIGFDNTTALAEVEQIRNLLQEKLNKSPIVVTVRAVGDLPNLDNLPKNATGGPIAGPGTGTSDSILSWLSNGEYVIKAAAVKRYGRSMLDSLNSMNLPKFSTGGLASMSHSPAPVAAGTPINLHFDGQQFQTTAEPDMAKAIEKFFRNQAVRRGGKR